VYKKARPLFLTCETSLHAGSGSDLGLVDLPIQRERHTGFPKLEGAGVKGCLRQAFEQMDELMVGDEKYTDKNEINEIIAESFGPKVGDLHAGSLGFSDARLLLFPVKSMKGVFAWITCPRVLNCLKKDLELCEMNNCFELPSENSLPSGSNLLVKGQKIILEEYCYELTDIDNEDCTKLAEWLAENVLPSQAVHSYWKGKMKKDVVVLADDDFRDFVTLSTEVVTRTAIDSATGTASSGALFTEEYLPPETVMYSLVLASPMFCSTNYFVQDGKNGEEVVLNFFSRNLKQCTALQLGGNSTVGKGIVWTRCNV